MEKHPLDYSDLGDSLSKRQRQVDAPLRDEQATPQQPPENALDNANFICDDCKAVDWSSLPTLAADGSLAISNRSLRPLNGSDNDLRNSCCRICARLSTLTISSYGHSHQLIALPLSRQRYYDGHRLPSNIASRCAVLGTLTSWGRTARSTKRCDSTKCLAVVRIDDLEAMKVSPRSIDYDRFKDLMNTCEKNHKNCCGAQPGPNVLGLEVIDTKTQEIIKAPDGCRYLALSYVWGKEASNSSSHDIRKPPPVIRDAISVTNFMGYKYLWVDRYCISDSNDKHRMISQMDQIYANASFTIIAAADGDTELGLCGVSMPRHPQQHIKVQDVALLELPLPRPELDSTKWATRGWTYQEGYLSRRRLIFTKSQVVFLCNGMYATESLQKLMSNTCFSDDTRDFHHLIPQFKSLQRRALLLQIQEYSKRELTRSDDSLNAILGVLNYYARASAKLKSPVLQLPWGLVARKLAKKNAFGLFIFWSHRDKQLPTRRPEFPSWSWTGWGGPLFFDHQEIILHSRSAVREDFLSYIECTLFLKDGDGNTLEMYDLALKEFEARKFTRRLHQPGPKQLQVTCLVIPVSFQDFDLTEQEKNHETTISIHDTGQKFLRRRAIPNGSCPILQAWKGIYIGPFGELCLDQKVEEHDHILGLLLGGRRKGGELILYQCLLVRETGGGLYERMGLLGMGLMEGLTWSDTACAYLDAMGNLLDQFEISDMQRRHPFADTADRRTICLV